MNQCTNNPISWLRLEAHALGEIRDRDERTKIVEHLDQCVVCAASLAEIANDNDNRSLSDLRLPSRDSAKASETDKPSGWQGMLDWLRGKNRWFVVGGGLLATTAVMMLFVLSGPQRVGEATEAPYRASVGIKGGGEFVLTLVRDRAGVISRAPTSFSSGDRFKLSLTCSEPGALELDVVVVQSGKLHRPLGAPTIHCGNNILIPGAFAATGPDAFEVCVAPNPNRSSLLTALDLKYAACVTLAAAKN